MAEDTNGSIIGLAILFAIGYGVYAFIDKKPSEEEQNLRHLGGNRVRQSDHDGN